MDNLERAKDILEKNRYTFVLMVDGKIIKTSHKKGIISAPEADHAIRATIDEAIKCRESGEAKTILLALSGHGHVDMAAYQAYFDGKLEDHQYSLEKIEEALHDLPKV